ncbi:MAG: type II toxin-antitoxin system RelE/ParE family toxin [Gammaproteobacteria bacterium]|nr:type II toxin-antitoxin system RelE/ParE family toxin [Gammaproteobacteria bacterium]MDO9317730.1 type II toxin-antitoxin system RelE/ParE family toxin [Gammaproteobacteria bacterium]
MTKSSPKAVRAFKTAWFAKEARKAKISDGDLCRAIQQVIQGLADDLGGGVFKKRLNDNMHRSIILAKAGKHWIYAYLYAKKDRENITPNELSAFKRLAKDYANAGEDKIATLLRDEELLEICHDN